MIQYTTIVILIADDSNILWVFCFNKRNSKGLNSLFADTNIYNNTQTIL